MPIKNILLYDAVFVFALLLSLTSCNNNNSAGRQESNSVNNARENTAANYSDSLLLDDTKPDDTVKITENDTEDNDLALPEERQFEEFYNKVAAALNKGDISAINKYIHASWGIYVIDRPGAIDKVDTAKNIQSYYKKIYLGQKRLQGMMCQLEHRPIPGVICDKAYKGCLAETTTNYHRISDLKKALHGYGFKDNYLPKDDESLSKFENLVKRNVVNFDKSIGISFLRIDGKWYIGVIDLAKYTCSA
jgi:hypothetical protein